MDEFGYRLHIQTHPLWPSLTPDSGSSYNGRVHQEVV